jgi:hypothetical protein
MVRVNESLSFSYHLVLSCTYPPALPARVQECFFFCLFDDPCRLQDLRTMSGRITAMRQALYNRLQEVRVTATATVTVTIVRTTSVSLRLRRVERHTGQVEPHCGSDWNVLLHRPQSYVDARTN